MTPTEHAQQIKRLADSEGWYHPENRLALHTAIDALAAEAGEAMTQDK